MAAARASWLALPMTKLSNVRSRFRREWSWMDSSVAACTGAGWGGVMTAGAATLAPAGPAAGPAAGAGDEGTGLAAGAGAGRPTGADSSNWTCTAWEYQSDAIDSRRVEKFLRTQSSLKRLGAPILRTASSSS